MKILQLITRGELGGGQKHVVDLLAGMKDRYQMELGTGEEGYLTDTARALGIPVHFLPDLVQPISPLQDMRGLASIARLIRRIQPDLVHTHTSKAGALGRMAARLRGVPCLFTAHTWCFAEGTSWKWKLIGTPLERWTARWSGAIINVSEANRQLALRQRIAAANKLITIHNGVPDCPHRASPGEGSIPNIVMVARFAPQKAHADLIHAIRDIDLPLRVQFIGDGSARAAHEALATQLGVRDRIDFLGVRTDVMEILGQAHIFALPTNWEGFPLTILEAMRSGLPVVASHVGGIGEAVVPGVTGFLTPAGSIPALTDALRQLVASPALRGAMGSAARARYESEFTVDVMLRKTIAIYQSILEERASVPYPLSTIA